MTISKPLNQDGLLTASPGDDELPGLLFERFSNKLIRMCHSFYRDPKNEEAYQAWRAARQQKEEIV
ncbi:MAG: hypothetical protein J6V15_04005 [Clostridia bacterium]|nr:hypothetical protein [Clostridia bacterium]